MEQQVKVRTGKYQTLLEEKKRSREIKTDEYFLSKEIINYKGKFK
jgi:hypothetical protein